MPYMQHFEGRAALKLVAIVGISELDHALMRKKQKKAAWIVRGVHFLLLGYATVHNLRFRPD